MDASVDANKREYYIKQLARVECIINIDRVICSYRNSDFSNDILGKLMDFRHDVYFCSDNVVYDKISEFKKYMELMKSMKKPPLCVKHTAKPRHSLKVWHEFLKRVKEENPHLDAQKCKSLAEFLWRYYRIPDYIEKDKENELKEIELKITPLPEFV